MKERVIIGRAPEHSSKKNPSYQTEWKDVMTLPGAKDVLDEMVAEDKDAEHFFEKRARELLFDQSQKDMDRMVRMRDLFLHQKQALAELRTAVNEKNLTMGTFGTVIRKNRFFLPDQLLVFLEPAFRKPLFGPKPFNVKELLIGEELNANNEYVLSDKERSRLGEALDLLIVRHDHVVREFDIALKVKDFANQVSQLPEDDSVKEEKEQQAA